MNANWPINLLFITGILVIINNIFIFTFKHERIGGGRLVLLLFIILLTMGALFGSYMDQIDTSRSSEIDYAGIYDRNEQLSRINDSLYTLIWEIRSQYDRMNQTLKPMTEIARKKYPDLSPEDALEKLAGHLETLEKTINEMRPRLVYLGDSTELTESRGEAFYFTTYYFRANGAAVRDLVVRMKFSGYIAAVTGRIFSGTQALEKGRVILNADSKGFTYKLDLLPLESDLRITVKSRDWLSVKSKEWSPR